MVLAIAGRVVVAIGGAVLRGTRAAAPLVLRSVPPVARASTQVTVGTLRVATRAVVYGGREALIGATGIGRLVPRGFGRATLPERLIYTGVRLSLATARRTTRFVARAGLREAIRLTLTPYYAAEAAYGVLRNPRLRRGATTLAERFVDARLIGINKFLYNRGLQSSLVQTGKRLAEYYVLEKAFNHFSVTQDKVQNAVVEVYTKAKSLQVMSENPTPVMKPGSTIPNQEPAPTASSVIRKPAKPTPQPEGVRIRRVNGR